MKKLLSLLVAFFMIVALVGCGNSFDFQSRFDLVFKDVDTAAVESNIQLPTKVGSLTFEWTSSNPDVITNSGEVKRAKDDVKVTLSALMTYQDETETLEIELTVKGVGDVVLAKNTIKEALDGAIGTYEVAGTVVAANAQSFLIKDETGMVMSFHGNTFAQDVNVGDIVLLTGETTVYGAAKQFKNATYSVIASEEVVASEPKEYTAAELDTLVNTHADDKTATFTPEYVKVNGTIAISGNYFNLNIDGTSKAVGSLVYPVNADELTAQDGKKVEVLAYLTGVTGPGRYLQLMVVSYKVDESVEPEPKPEPTGKTIGEIIAAENGAYETTGVVVGVNAQSFLISDGTGIMLVYNGYSWQADVKVGDKLKVSGTSTVYGKAVQFGQGSSYEKIGTETVDHGQAKELTAADCDAYAGLEIITPEYAKVKGTLSVSDNKYYNVKIEGATIIGSITYPANADEVKALDGKEIEIVGYVTGTSSKDAYLNFLALEVKATDGSTPDPDPEPNPSEEKTLAEIIAAENGEFTATGVVVGVNARSFLIKDETGIMLVYNGGSWSADVVVGDKVKVTGSTTVYGKAKQFGEGSTYEKVESVTVDHGQVKELTAADCDAYAGLEIVKPEYVKVKGNLTVSGYYFNVAIEGATITGSITYPSNSDELKAFDGKEIEIVGYVTGTSSKDAYLNFLALEVKATDGTTPEPNPGPTDEADAVISFADIANRTSFSTEGQVWEQNGIKVTNNKGASTSNVADYSNPVRFYKNSDVVIEHAEKIAKIVITTKGESKYQIQAGDTFEGATLSVNGTVATIVLNEAANSYTFTCSGRQLRIATIEIYFAE